MVRITTTGRPPAPRALPFWHILAVTAVALTTANCSGPTQKFARPSSGNGIDPKYGVKASPRLYSEGEAIPKGGGRRFSGRPYVVAGRTYVPREEARGYVREGLASWYGSAFHGRLTANGEVFDRHSVAAAHPTLPLPSYARVTNLANGHSMVVRVNDRGPYHADRVMDVSEEVANALDFHRKGTARVRVEYVGKASTAGSDDRKLMATLRTDGRPATVGGRSPVMLADLGPETAGPSPERLARASRAALAFKAASEEDEAPEASPAPRPARPAPVLIAGAASVAVPEALQPTATRATAFRPSAIHSEPPAAAPRMAAASTRVASDQGAPLSLAPPPLRLASAGPERMVTARADAGGPGQAGPRTGPAAGLGRPIAPALTQRMAQPAAQSTAKAAPGGQGARPVLASSTAATRLAGPASPAAMPVSSKLAIARLAAAPIPPAAQRGKPATAPVTMAATPKPAAGGRRSRVAEID